MPRATGDRLRRERVRELPDLVQPGEVRAQVRPRVGEVLVEERVDDRHQQERVGARPDEVVLVGLARGARAARVDDDELAAAGADAAQAPAGVRRGHQRAVGDERVRAEDQQVHRAVEVGHRDAQPRPEHQRRRELLGELVDGARREDVARAERLQQDAPVEERAERVGGRVADVRGQCLAAVLGLDVAEALVDERERLVPGDLVEPAVRASQQRRAQPVGVMVELGDRGALGADEALAEDVVRVAADLHDPVALQRQLEPAGGLAERARADGGGRLGGHGRMLPGRILDEAWLRRPAAPQRIATSA